MFPADKYGSRVQRYNDSMTRDDVAHRGKVGISIPEAPLSGISASLREAAGDYANFTEVPRPTYRLQWKIRTPNRELGFGTKLRQWRENSGRRPRLIASGRWHRRRSPEEIQGRGIVESRK